MKPTRLLLALALLAAANAGAQLRLPSLPQLPTAPIAPLERTLRNVEPSVPQLDLQGLRQRSIRELLRQAPERVELDPAGEPMLRNELVAVSPSDAAIAAAQAAGFGIVREQRLEGLDERLVILGVPAGLSTAQALRRLRELDPQGQYDFDHLYTRGGPQLAPGTSPPAPAEAKASTANSHGRVGLVDSGVDLKHPALREAAVRTQGCAGRMVSSAHGTAIASLLVGKDGAFQGVMPGATLYAADVYCGDVSGGSADAIAQALAWMAREQVAVVNLSLVGPPNKLLERVVGALTARGHLVVAAVGNDGPAAAPLYPAAYPGVVAVTGVDARRRVLPEAGQGPHVAFAAPGADLAVAASGDAGYLAARGTSFAAPLVAGLLAQRLKQPSPAQAERAVSELAAEAIDLGPPGRDKIYGWGLVAEAYRIDPARLARADDGAAQRLGARH